MTYRAYGDSEAHFRSEAHFHFALKLLLVALFSATSASSQSVQISPDCFFYRQFTSAARYPSTGYDNRKNGCVSWTVTYYNSGFTTLNLRLESAQDSAGAPGAWGAFAGTVVAGVNPNVATTSAYSVINGLNPWVSVNLTGLTGSGTVSVYAYGCRTLTCAAVVASVVGPVVTLAGPLGQSTMAGSVPVTIASDQTAVPVTFSGTEDVNLKQVGGSAVSLGQQLMAASIPVVLASNQPSISTTPGVYCDHQAVFNLSGSGNTQIIAVSGSTVISICHLSLATVGPEDIKVTEGTGSNCASNQADLTGLYKNATALAFDFGSASPLVSTAARAVCLNQSVGQATGGVVVYRQQ